MRLSQEAIDLVLAIVAQFDRERGVPHDYYDLEQKLKGLAYVAQPDGSLAIEIPGKQPESPKQVVTMSPKSVLIDASKSWG